MKTKFTQSLPLLGTFLALIIGGAVLFKFTPVDAVLDASKTDVPPTNAATEADTAEPLTDPETAVAIDPMVTAEPILYMATDTNIPTGKTVNGIYAEANQDVTLADHYLNDVYVAGNNITITGTIEGDLFAAGETITINGTVMGSVRAAGNKVTVNGAVGRNVMVFANELSITPNAHVGQDVVLGSAKANIDAMVMGNISGGADQLTIGSVVEGDINLQKVGTLTFGPEAYVMGDVNYTAHREATINQTATLLGTVNYTEEVRDRKPVMMAGAVMLLLKLIISVLAWIGCLILGIVLIKCCPKLATGVVERMRNTMGRSFGYGALVLIVMPLALLIIAATIIGLPLAFAGLLSYLLVLMAAKVYVGLALGKMIFRNSKSMVGPFIFGFSVFYIITNLISWLGFGGMMISGVIGTLALTWALGAVVTHCKHQS